MADMMQNNHLPTENLFNQISRILNEARTKVATTVNTAMVAAYWHIGKLIVDEQGGESNASYGDNLINSIAKRLTDNFGKGFSARNLRNMRQFFIAFPIWQTVSAKLSWSHYMTLMRVSSPKAREYYAESAACESWSVRQLERQIATQYYERLLSSHRDDNEIKEIIAKNLPVKADKFDPLELVHDPFVLEFLDLRKTGSTGERT